MDANRVEELRYMLELFIDGSDRSPEYVRQVAEAVQDELPGDPVVDAFLTSAMVFGAPAVAFYRTEEEMARECEGLRRHIGTLG